MLLLPTTSWAAFAAEALSSSGCRLGDRECLEQLRVPLDRGSLHIVMERAEAAELFTATGAARPAVQHLRHRHSVTCRLGGVCGVEHE
jgi:hypothetical protein